MELTPEIKFLIENIKGKLLLDDKKRIIVLTETQFEMVLKKPLFGKQYYRKELTALIVVASYHIGTEFHGVYKENRWNLRVLLEEMQQWRKDFLAVKESLDKFGFLITKPITIKSEGC